VLTSVSDCSTSSLPNCSRQDWYMENSSAHRRVGYYGDGACALDMLPKGKDAVSAAQVLQGVKEMDSPAAGTGACNLFWECLLHVSTYVSSHLLDGCCATLDRVRCSRHHTQSCRDLLSQLTWEIAWAQHTTAYALRQGCTHSSVCCIGHLWLALNPART
jgi:hypothetical protein